MKVSSEDVFGNEDRYHKKIKLTIYYNVTCLNDVTMSMIKTRYLVTFSV